MNIVFLLRFWPVYGGGETVTRILANKLVEDGYNVSLVYLWDRRQDNMPFIDNRIEEYKIPGISEPYRVENIRKRNYPAIGKYLRNFFIEKKIDMVINQWFPPKEVYRSKRRTKASLICCYHTNIIQNHIVLTWKHKIFYAVLGKRGIRIRKFLIKQRLSDNFKYSDKWIFLSEYFADEAKKMFKKNSGKITVIHNPLTYTYFLRSEEIEFKQKEVIYVGRIDNNKRVEYIIEAWAKLEKIPRLDDWRLTLVGDGVNLQNIKNCTERLDCKRVLFEGQQIPVPYYKRASIFAFASANEGWAVVLLEAQQYGCIPIAMDSYTSLHEIIQNNNNGVIVNDKDIKGFTEALERLMLDGEYRRRLALGGVESCRRFSINNIIKQWEALFDDLCSQSMEGLKG
jgi:glycosyltransferase involved in cell wall biosynthesis